MEKSEYAINIVGSGISGLVAALVLEKEGYSTTLYEATDRAGGRIKTDIYEGFQLDHGFQVLLDAYPMAKKYLDMDSLALQKFLPGAVIFKDGKNKTLGDPLRNVSLLIPTLLANIGTISDKFKILKLNSELKAMTMEQIFASKETSTLTYLKDRGFSDDIISSFFKTFFSGIFLEPNLDTSCRMFQFVYKMFGEGLAVLPKAGIGAIAGQLASKLKRSNIMLNTPVKRVLEGKLILADGKELPSHYTILATDASHLTGDMKMETVTWKRCETFYFICPKRIIPRPLIGLIADKDALINNLFFHTSLEMAHRGEGELLSVTLVKEHQLSDKDVLDRVVQELERYCGISELSFLKRYQIKKALPQLANLQYSMTPQQTQWSSGIYLAGDHHLYGSLNAAMTTGEMAAKGILEHIKKGS
ncbi:oxidoreductase [Sediminicola sp. YIK13]|uniref:NAD(P)/FAD-dependent oxidoreductase n=1 Tax=Sediminicola sp. YIK13 TaxID=1453352 RepID=UPI00072289D9|nr:NAD(P)/FAD-dependent oxidoreductase [Sediminicola sp. YIK13]ALM07066.1 oxidoreductase [Sediminicola sp. YIK13]